MAPTAGSCVAIYSTGDLSLVRLLGHRMREHGLPLWIDVDELGADDTWDTSFHAALAEHRCVAFVVSDIWDYDDGLLDDLAVVFSAIEDASVPLDAVHINLGLNEVPDGLEALRWVALRLEANEPRGETVSEIHDAVQSLTQDEVAAWWAFIGDTDRSLVALRRALRHRLDRAFGLWTDDDLHTIEDEWGPFEGSATFDLEHATWQSRPGLRQRLHMAKCLLFMTAVQLGQRDPVTYGPLAVRRLKELVNVEPYVETSGLSGEEIGAANDNYRDALTLALQWYEAWGPEGLDAFGVPEHESTSLMQRVRDRRRQLPGA